MQIPVQSSITNAKNIISPLHAVQRIMYDLGGTLDLHAIMYDLNNLVQNITQYQRVLLLIISEEDTSLKYGNLTPTPDDADIIKQLQHISINIYRADYDMLINDWLAATCVALSQDAISAHKDMAWLAKLLNTDNFYTVPMLKHGRLIGVLMLDQYAGQDATDEQLLLKEIAPHLAIVLENARQHSTAVTQLATRMNELHILRQIDRELSDTISHERVFNITLDWALRYTNAHAASLALYDELNDELRYVIDIGYDLGPSQIELIRQQFGGGIVHRVARSARTEIIPDIQLDKDHVRISNTMRALMVVPIMREDRVNAVMSIQSRRINAFTESHIDFIEKLAARAAVAIDNARLFSESVYEREKLTRILSSIADAIIVVNPENRLIMVNQSAIATLRLYNDHNYVGRPFNEVFDHPELLHLYNQARSLERALIGEVQLPNGRNYHVNLAFYDGIGWIIAMHDITLFKETANLEKELVATVSHDLKQPLSVMNGYSELLLMRHQSDQQATSYVKMIQVAITNMRELIDDLLDLAKIDSGIQLEIAPVAISGILSDCIKAVKQSAQYKSMLIHFDANANLPIVRGDRGCLSQIFTNLLSNAIKYTPPEGEVRIITDIVGDQFRIGIKDNGLGISPEDQARIFERFYRVRRPETDSIDGTGLGLAIVKKLVELHNGQIGLESNIGDGSTFYVTLPIYRD